MHNSSNLTATQRAQAAWGLVRRTLRVPVTIDDKPAQWEVVPPPWVDPYIKIAEGDLEDLDLTLEDLQPGVPTYDTSRSFARKPSKRMRFENRFKGFRSVIVLVVLAGMLVTLAPACDINWTSSSPDPSECLEFERTADGVDRKIIIEIDISQSAKDHKDEFIDQVDAFLDTNMEPGDPSASIEVIAQSESVMTEAIHLAPIVTTNFETGDNTAVMEDNLDACRQLIKDETTQALNGAAPAGGSDPFGGMAYAANQFTGSSTENLLLMLGDGYATASTNCDLNAESLADHTTHEDLARRCAGGDPPAFGDNVQAFMGGVGLRSDDGGPGPGGSDHANDLIVFYRDTVLPLAGVQAPIVKTTLGLEDFPEAA